MGYTGTLVSICVLCFLVTWAPSCASSRPQVYSNSSLGSRGPLDRRQALMGALPAATAGLGGLLVGGVLYGLALLPAVVALLGGGLPLTGLFQSLFRHKRSSSGGKSDGTGGIFDAEDTQKLLRLLHDAVHRWDTASEPCRRRYVCQISGQAFRLLPDLRSVDDAVTLLFTGVSSVVGKGPSMDLFRAARDGVRNRNGCQEFHPCDAPLRTTADPKRNT